jgi:glyoxylase-like metal-dependent hydrolase (beta-lactamase superfamily II)
MKSNVLILAYIFYSSLLNLCGKNSHPSVPWFTAKEIFPNIYTNAADSEETGSISIPSAIKNAANNILREAVPSPDDNYKGKEIYFQMVTVKDGDIFNLGGRHIQVIGTPGHTPGSICLLDKENKLLFTGDNDNTAVWLFLPNSLPIAEYFETLQT